MPDYEQLDTVVLGVNPGKFKGHEKFDRKHDFGFPLIYDENWKIAYGFRLLSLAGLMQARTVYILDKEMRVQYVFKGMPSTADLKQELERINQQQTQ